MEVTIKNTLPDGIKFTFSLNGINFLVIKRGKRKNAKDTIANVYSDSELIQVDTLCESNTQTHNQSLVPQFNF